MKEQEKIGKGIKIMSIIFIVLNVIGFIGGIYGVLSYDNTVKFMTELGKQEFIPPITSYYVSIAISIVTLVFLVLIMKKNKVGVFGYFGLIILSRVYTTITTGSKMFNIFSIIGLVISLVIQGLYAYFIYKKRELYGITVE